MLLEIKTVTELFVIRRLFQTVLLPKYLYSGLDLSKSDLGEIAKEQIMSLTTVPWVIWSAGLLLTAIGVVLLYFLVLAQTSALIPTSKQGYCFILFHPSSTQLISYHNNPIIDFGGNISSS